MPYKGIKLCIKNPDHDSLTHKWEVDEEDTRFMLCIYCGNAYYRTDEDLIEELRKEGLVE